MFKFRGMGWAWANYVRCTTIPFRFIKNFMLSTLGSTDTNKLYMKPMYISDSKKLDNLMFIINRNRQGRR